MRPESRAARTLPPKAAIEKKAIPSAKGPANRTHGIWRLHVYCSTMLRHRAIKHQTCGCILLADHAATSYEDRRPSTKRPQIQGRQPDGTPLPETWPSTTNRTWPCGHLFFPSLYVVGSWLCSGRSSCCAQGSGEHHQQIRPSRYGAHATHVVAARARVLCGPVWPLGPGTPRNRAWHEEHASVCGCAIAERKPLPTHHVHYVCVRAPENPTSAVNTTTPKLHTTGCRASPQLHSRAAPNTTRR